MTHNLQAHHRRSIRLRDYDYAQAGAYFVTICTKNKECIFETIVDPEMRVNEYGDAVAECWNGIPEHFPTTELDEFVVMPNHVHGIIVIVDSGVGARHASPLRTDNIPSHPKGTGKGTLGAIVGSFKSAVTKRINELPNSLISNPWQRGYYEHVVRNEQDLIRIREYILNNPANWESDDNNPSSNIQHSIPNQIV